MNFRKKILARLNKTAIFPEEDIISLPVKSNFERVHSAGQPLNAWKHKKSGEIINLMNGTWRVQRKDGDKGSLGNGVDMYRYEHLDKAMQDVDQRANELQQAASVKNKFSELDPNKKNIQKEIRYFSNAHSSVETIWPIKSGVHDILEKYGYDTSEWDDWNIQLYAAGGGASPGVSIEHATARKSFQLAKKTFLIVSIYRKDNGTYELTAYIQ